MLRGWPVRLAGAAATGVATSLAFPPYAQSWLLPLVVAALVLLVGESSLRVGWWIGLAYGFAFMVTLLPWLTVIGPDAWLALSLLEALFYGVLGVGLVALRRLSWWPLWAACWWVAIEAFRGLLPWGGFNWGRLAYATVDTPVAPVTTYAGVAGASLLVVLAGALLAWTLLHVSTRRVRGLLAAGAALVVLLAPALLPAWSADDAPTVRVAVVQGNVPGTGMRAFAERRVVLDNHVEATLDLARRVAAGEEAQPDLVIWPENSTDIDPYRDATVRADIQAAVDAVGVPILVGAMVEGAEPTDVENQGIVWLPESGPSASYSKRHPVPFGEYIPLRDVFAPYIDRLDQIPRDMVPGDAPGVLPIDGTTVGDVICFEVIYDDLIRDVVRGGAEMLVVQTNNATYMDTGQVEQQFATARLRALETRRYVVVAATNGISGIVDPNGDVVTRARERSQAVLGADVPTLTALTPAMRFGEWTERGMIAVGSVAVVAGLVLRRRESSRPGTDTGGGDGAAPPTTPQAVGKRPTTAIG